MSFRRILVAASDYRLETISLLDNSQFEIGEFINPNYVFFLLRFRDVRFHFYPRDK